MGHKMVVSIGGAGATPLWMVYFVENLTKMEDIITDIIKDILITKYIAITIYIYILTIKDKSLRMIWGVLLLLGNHFKWFFSHSFSWHRWPVNCWPTCPSGDRTVALEGLWHEDGQGRACPASRSLDWRDFSPIQWNKNKTPTIITILVSTKIQLQNSYSMPKSCRQC